MRIVGGDYKGTQIFAPKGNATRPTSDRVREALFNVLAHGIDDFELEGTRVLDLFAGTGALGLEALSRGAEFCLLVDDGIDARGAIRRNIEAMGAMGRTKLFKRNATKLGDSGTVGQFDLLFADPPYDKGLGEKALIAAYEGNWLADGALCVLEERTGNELAFPDGFAVIDERRYGDTTIWMGRFG